MRIDEEDEELHDLSDDSDYAASLNQGLVGSILSDSGEINGVGGGFDEGDKFEVVFLKDHVAIHPRQNSVTRISGRLRIAKQRSNLFLRWIPYKPSFDRVDSWDGSTTDPLARDRNLYTIKDLPMSGVHSIRRHTPPIGWQYVIIIQSSGLAYPPLYFYNGGVREFVATIKQHVVLTRSADDGDVFLLNNLQDPLQRSLSSLELPRAITTANTQRLHNSEYSGRQELKAYYPAREISLQVLETFSLVTKFARETTSQIFCDNNGFNSSVQRQKSDSLMMNEITNASNDRLINLKENLVPADPFEVDKLSLDWGKSRQHPLSSEEWAAFLDTEGRITDSKALKERIFYGGVENNLRKEVWKLLLGYHDYDTTFAERDYIDSVKRSEYKTLKTQWQSISQAQAKRFTKFRERKGLIEKDVVRTDRSVSFFDGDDNPYVTLLHDILLTYSFYNFDLGYCQGMSDLLSPILFVMGDEAESFWCFVALMDRLGPNFNRDQNGMHSQLFALSKLVEILDEPLHDYFKQNDCLNYFYCFRWILIQFKREFEYEKVMQLWEILWTHHLSEHFHLYICVAILKKQRKKIMEEEMDFDTLLRFINGMSGHINLDEIIKDAEVLCMCAGEKGAACIPPGTPPSLPVETTGCYSPPDQL